MTVEVFLFNDDNQKVGLLPDLFSLEAVLTENNFSACNIIVPAQKYAITDFERDYRLQIQINGQVFGSTQFLIRERGKSLTRRGEKLLSIRAFNAIHLLERRYILYYSGSTQARKDTNPDDFIRAIVRENLGSLAQTGSHVVGTDDDNRYVDAPDLSAYFTVEADTTTITPTFEKSVSARNLLDVIQEICLAAWQAGTWLGFDVVLNDSNLLEFRAYTNQRGENKGSGSSNLIVFSPERGNLTDIQRTWDWTQEITIAIALGQNEAHNRAFAVEQDDRKDLSSLNWIERTIDARNSTSLAPEAQQLVRDNRPRDIFTGKALDTPGTKFMEHYSFGDIVACQFEGETFDARISALRYQVRQGGYEEKDIAFRVEG